MLRDVLLDWLCSRSDLLLRRLGNWSNRSHCRRCLRWRRLRRHVLLDRSIPLLWDTNLRLRRLISHPLLSDGVRLLLEGLRRNRLSRWDG